MAEEFGAIRINSFVSGQGMKFRIPVRVISQSNVNLAANLDGTTIDGIVVADGDRVLLNAQTTSTENGVYIIKTGAGNTLRSEDMSFDSGPNDIGQSIVSINEGTSYENTVWQSAGFGNTTTPTLGALNFRMKDILNYVVGDIFYANSSNTLNILSKPSQTGILQMNSSGSPSWTNITNFSQNLSLKEEALFGSEQDIGGTYSAVGGTAGTGSFTGLAFTAPKFDPPAAYTPTVGDRVLIKNQTDKKQNGIYIVTSASTLERADDHDGVPTTNVSGGDFIFVMDGSNQKNTGWLLEGYADKTLNTDNLSWVRFGPYYTGPDCVDVSAGYEITLNLATDRGLKCVANALELSLSDTDIQGTLPVGNGGTGSSTLTSGNIIIGNGTSPVNFLAPTSRKVLVTNSTPDFVLSNTVNLSTINGASDDLALLTFSPVGSAVNYFQITNSATGSNPILSAIGTDGNIGFNFQPKGTGQLQFLGTSTAPAQTNYYIDTDNGSKYIGLKAPDNITSTVVFTLPAADGNNGDVMITNGSGVLSFVSSTSTAKDISLRSSSFFITNTSYITIAYLTYDISRYGTSSSCAAIFEAEINTSTYNFRVRNVTGGSNLTTVSVTTSGFKSLAFTAPAVDSRIAFQVQRVGGGPHSRLYGLQLSIN